MVTSRPLQKKSWAEKTKNGYQDFKDNINYYISQSSFAATDGGSKRIDNLRTLYEVYNSSFPASWFEHITAPYSNGELAWPAKIRPMNIIRPNIEFLRGEYPKRPFNYQTAVIGEDGYNMFLEAKKKEVYTNISQLFINTVNEQGLDTGVDTKPVEMPDSIAQKFDNTFKNILAQQAQDDLDLIMGDQRVKEKLEECLKDWLIAGEVVTYKDVIRDSVVYEHVNPMEIGTDINNRNKFIEDRDWVVRRMLMTLPDVADRFYDTLKDSEIDDMDRGYFSSATNFVSYLQKSELYLNNKIPVYHVCWKSLEQFGVLSYPDPLTGEIQEDIVNEDYKPQEILGESVKWMWRTRWLEGYRVGDKIFTEMRPVRFSPSMMNNLSKSQGPYNGRNFSDTNAQNISILKMGLPFQIMFMIANFSLERTIAKSRGKVVLLDQNVVPVTGLGGDNDLNTFISFSETQGWGFINRTQAGVDTSYNQYQVLDLGLFDQMKNLIDIMEYCKTQYEDQIGVSKQAKAKTDAQESATGLQTAIYQTSVITEMIFAEFDRFVVRELQGLLDCSQIANIHGKRSSWVGSEGRTKLLDINPEKYSYVQMGIIVEDNIKTNDTLKKMKGYGQAFAQNGVKPSMLLAIENEQNLVKLEAIFKAMEAQEIEEARATAKDEQEARQEEIRIQNEFAEHKALLDLQRMHEEYNRKEDLVLTQGDINMALQEAGMEDTDDSVEATKALMDYQIARDKVASENDRKNRETNEKIKQMQNKNKRDEETANRKHNIMEKQHKLDAEIKKK